MSAGWSAAGFAAVAVLVWAVVGVLARWLRRRRVLDVPNERSSHEVPVPRGGGLGVLLAVGLGFVVAFLQGGGTAAASVAVGVLLVAVVGWLDDFTGGLPVLPRFGVQGAAAVVVLLGCGPIGRVALPPPLDVALPPVLGGLAVLVWVVGVANIYNFLDGIDGHAGFQGVVAGVGLAVIGWGTWVAPVGLAAAAGCVGFLGHNWHPARIFLGDVGSLPLGVLFASLPLAVPDDGPVSPVLVAGLLLWFFLADGAWTILRRLRAGERVWEAHRTHLYQRMTDVGLDHGQVVVWIGACEAVVGAAAVAAFVAGSVVGAWAALGAAVALFVALSWWARHRSSRLVHPSS